MIEQQTDVCSARRLRLQAADGHRILVDAWQPPEAVALVHLFHGLSEHPARYDRFARLCNTRGIAVAAHAHRGHGENCDESSLGHFSDDNGWNKVISDAAQVQDHLRQIVPDVPLVLIGHSMGSYIAQCFMMRGHGPVSALVLSASTYASRSQVRFGRWFAAFECWRAGKRSKSEMLNKQGFGNFNKRFEPARTPLAWLSRDDAEVDKYIQDPLCGATSSSRLWYDLMCGFLEITSSKALGRIPADLPILVTGGSEDPVGGRKGLSRLESELVKSGHSNVTLKLYEHGRHEMFNETNRDEFTQDLIQWMLAAVVTQNK